MSGKENLRKALKREAEPDGYSVSDKDKLNESCGNRFQYHGIFFSN